MNRKSTLLIIFILLPVFLSAQATKQELKIIKAIDNRTAAATALLKTAVNINSGTMNFSGVRKVGELFMAELRTLGFETRWSPGDQFHRAGHLIAVHKGKGKKLLLIGHLDTVFDRDSKFQTWNMLNDSIMQGPGVFDMKGGDVIIILAMQALHDAGLLDDLSIEIIMTGDEEESGDPITLSKKDIMEAAEHADIALGFEDGDGIANHALISRRGSSDWTLTVKGTAAHSSQVFTDAVGNGAIFEAARILNLFYQSLSKEENLTFNPGLIAGGGQVLFNDTTNSATASGKNNIVASDVIVTGDLRAFSLDQLKRTRQIMSDIVRQNDAHTSATIDFGDDGYPPMTLTEGNKKLLDEYSRVSMDLGFGEVTAVPPRKAGAADISFACDEVEMSLDGLGIAGAGGHTVQETANLHYLSIDAKRAAVLIARLGK
ncbi:MAG: M20/M25/M40 family metallo-hydrolase [Chitinophagales bacterium]|nr:M20/M25/M40 family metallo-hydrolase [Chitinophagales bacterium]